MSLRHLPVLALTLLTGCLSKGPTVEVNHYTLPLAELEGAPRTGTQPLRFDRVQSPPLLTRAMVWRVSETRVAPDEENDWAVHPADVLELRLRDLLFSRGGYAETLDVGAPLLGVRVLAMEGDATAANVARVRLVADLWGSEGQHDRRHFEATAALASRSPEALAEALAHAVEDVSVALVEWVEAL